MSHDFEYTFIKPDASLSDFVEGFWMLHYEADSNREVVILPDGRMDLFLSQSSTEPFHITLLGIETGPGQTGMAPHTRIFAISFKPLAAEYILHKAVADLINYGKTLPSDFWGFSVNDLSDFEQFCKKATLQLTKHLSRDIDERKRKLFHLVYGSAGAITIKALSEQVGWSSRQINRYFNRQFGLSLKAYCSILRFRASFEQIREGKLFPQQNFADQSHFIKEIKRLSGRLPKELNQNKNDRFIQFSTLPEK